MSGFRIDYHQVISQANDIENMADSLGSLRREIDQITNELRTVWKGVAAEEYLRQCEILKNKISSTSNSMQSVSRSIKHAAAEIRAEDLERQRQEERRIEQDRQAQQTAFASAQGISAGALIGTKPASSSTTTKPTSTATPIRPASTPISVKPKSTPAPYKPSGAAKK